MPRLLLLLTFVAACGGGGKALREPDEYTGCATDENWVTFDDNEPYATVDDTQAPAQITVTPEASAVLISWTRSPGDPGSSDGDVQHDGVGCNMCCLQWNLGSLAALHLPTISGDVFDLQFRLDSATSTINYRLLTTLQEWQSPDGLTDSWRGHTVFLTIYRMGVIQNNVKSGPFVGTMPAQFSQ